MRYPDGACILSAHIKALKHHKKFKEKKIKAGHFFLQFLPWHPFGRRLDVDFLFWVALIVYEFFLITFLM